MQTSKRQRDGKGSDATTQPIASSSGLRNSLHGNVFQLKLLMLFLIRGISMNYRFKLATEMPRYGGKFDDLVFRVEQIIVLENGTNEERCIYRFVQAKHKQDESLQITAAQLLKGDEGDFSLEKYFHSFCRDINNKPFHVQDCVLCANIGIDETDLLNQGIKLLQVSPPTSETDILTFENQSGEKKSAWFKLESTENLRQQMRQWSDVHFLAGSLVKVGSDTNKKLELRNELFKSYHVALLTDNVMTQQGKLDENFINNKNIKKDSTKRFRNVLSNGRSYFL